MAETFDINTLLPPAELQRIAMRPFSPSFYKEGNEVVATNKEYLLAFHFYTGRIPTPAEFLYGMYVDKIGDSHKTKHLPMDDKYCGYFYITGRGASGAAYGAVGKDIKASGMQHPDGLVPSKSRTDFTEVDVDPVADLSWMMDWSFSASQTYSLSSGNLSSLRTMEAAGDLVHETAPTYFLVTKHYTKPHFVEKNAYHPTTGGMVGSIDYIPNASEHRRPLMMGTCGEVGSGADLELATGYDLSGLVRPVSLRISCNPTA